MEIKKQIDALIKMRAKDENAVELQTLRNIYEKALSMAKNDRVEVNEDYIVLAAKKERKQLEDTAHYLTDSHEIALNKEAIKITERYIPEPVSREEIVNFVSENKDSCANIGAAMKALKMKFGDKLDGKSASSILKEIL